VMVLTEQKRSSGATALMARWAIFEGVFALTIGIPMGLLAIVQMAHLVQAQPLGALGLIWIVLSLAPDGFAGFAAGASREDLVVYFPDSGVWVAAAFWFVAGICVAVVTRRFSITVVAIISLPLILFLCFLANLTMSFFGVYPYADL
jgi:hypothetical protein